MARDPDRDPKDPDAWRASWSEAPGLVTLDVDGSAWRAVRHGPDRDEVRVDPAQVTAILELRPRAITVAAGADAAWTPVERLAAARGIPFRAVDRRQALAAGATFGFGGACLAIDCGAVVTVDFADGDRYLAGETAIDAQHDDATAFCAAVDRAIYATAAVCGADGPLLVITGPGALVYVESGRLPVQHIPDLVHRGLVERTIR
ncbi:MAG: hypothetical protein AAF628_34990 [Planctomycetota bacterium]